MESPGLGQKVTRYLFIFFNILFTIIGLGLVVTGSYGVARAKSEESTDLLELIPAQVQSDENVDAVRSSLIAVGGVIITVGLVTMFISSCGWIGACKQNTCLLFTFSVCMVIIVLLEFILGITILVAVKKLNDPKNEFIHKKVTEAINLGEEEYALHKNDTSVPNKIVELWDLVQAEGGCCGINGPNDWKVERNDTRPINVVPNACKDPDTNEIYQIGCLPAYKEALKEAGGAVGGVAIAFCVIEIFGVFISCYLAFSMRKAGATYEQH